jgi:hypothetical protein
MMNILYQSHAGSWALLLIFFLLSYFFTQKKWLSMIARLFYVIMLVTGVGMLVLLGFPMIFLLKGVLAILLLGLMEMLVAKKQKEQPHTWLWVAWAVILVLVLLIGFNVIG